MAMGIQPWYLRNPPVEPEPEIEQAPLVDVEPPQHHTSENSSGTSVDVSLLDWDALEARVSACHLCELSETRTRTVFGVGNQQADLMIIGEAPGEEEDRQGEPFVGRAGKLLDAMLNAIGFARDQVYIANILKCRPPGNRNPHASEIICCESYLQRQIELVQPRMILALGRIAAHHLLMSEESIAALRRRQHSYNGIPLRVSYHPAYLLRSPLEKRKSWQDLIQVKRAIYS